MAFLFPYPKQRGDKKRWNGHARNESLQTSGDKQESKAHRRDIIDFTTPVEKSLYVQQMGFPYFLSATARMRGLLLV